MTIGTNTATLTNIITKALENMTIGNRYVFKKIISLTKLVDPQKIQPALSAHNFLSPSSIIKTKVCGISDLIIYKI